MNSFSTTWCRRIHLSLRGSRMEKTANEELHYLYISVNIFRVSKLRSTRWVEHVGAYDGVEMYIAI